MRKLFVVVLVAACAPSVDGRIRRPPGESGFVPSGDTDADADADTDSDADVDTDTDTDTDTDADTAPPVQTGPCPVDMSLVDDLFCVDDYEGALEELDNGSWVAAEPYYTVDGRTVRAVPAHGIEPQGYISGDEAQDACEASGKRLCTSDEWLSACRGPDDYVYPYGDTYDPNACNDTYEGGHPVTDYFGTSDGVWDSDHMNDPGINQQPNTVSAGGSYAKCKSVWGAFDMHGNLHEWVEDADGTFRGGFYADAVINGPGCTYATTAHDRGYHDYSTGFRCCADPVW